MIAVQHPWGKTVILCWLLSLAHTVNSSNRMYSEMPSNASQLDEVMCGPYNRRGLLCGECKDGYGPAVYSFDQKCAKCSSLWVYRYLSRFLSARKRLAITAFAEALHSCFKDGLNGTRDYRALAGGTVFVVLLSFLIGMVFQIHF
ncbi:hypothetical protein GBAR_LOCUS6154 [Geodia barretti]|uniref:Uncharacterized protein n=1 Tax=Geodia barretti TaxID=519541 RepID=A0AA35RCS4_GEOBA|nr:hypothetical protein GBAR_LOCUS6154 [Geodia barretti]